MPLRTRSTPSPQIYRATADYSAAASKTLAELTELGYGDLPVCIARPELQLRLTTPS